MNRRDPARETFVRRTAAVFGWPASEVVARLSEPRRPSLRINTLKAGVADFEGLEPIPWCPDAFHVHGDKATIVASPEFREGRVWIQNASSLIPPLALDVRPGQSVLDACAAPGGKSAHVAAIVGNEVELWLNDALRLPKLREIVELLGVRAASLTAHPAQYIDKFVSRRFDRILLDAQCGGEGMLDLAHPNAMRFWSLERIRTYSLLQQRMLRACWRLLEPGGILVYSTCTFSPEENEAPIAHLLRHVPEARIEPIELPIPGRHPGLATWERERWSPELRHAVRVAPSAWFEGFFVCRIRKA